MTFEEWWEKHGEGWGWENRFMLKAGWDAAPKPHRAVCSHCYGSKEMCDNCDNGSRFCPLCRADGVASA